MNQLERCLLLIRDVMAEVRDDLEQRPAELCDGPIYGLQILEKLRRELAGEK